MGLGWVLGQILGRLRGVKLGAKIDQVGPKRPVYVRKNVLLVSFFGWSDCGYSQWFIMYLAAVLVQINKKPREM